jgi:hypothetical protein
MQYWMMKELTLKASLAYDEEDFAKTVQNFSEGQYRILPKFSYSHILWKGILTTLHRQVPGP